MAFDFNQREMPFRPVLRGERDDKPRKSRAAAKIDPLIESWRMLEKLQAVGDVPRPDIRKRRRRDEVVRALPLRQEGDEALKIGPRAGGEEPEPVESVPRRRSLMRRSGPHDPPGV